MLRILIVAAYASVRTGLHTLLADAPEVEIVGAVGGSADAQAILSQTSVSVVVAEDVPDDRAALLDALTSTETSLVLLGEARDYAFFVPPALPGWAYLLKTADAPEILAASRAVAEGLIALDRSLISVSREAALFHPVRLEPGTEELTPRERETLQLMARGLLNKQIAARLEISLHTAKFHVASVLGKLGASSRTEAVTLGVRRGDVLL